MGFIPTIRLRKAAGVAEAATEFDDDKHDVGYGISDSVCDALSLEAKNEREVRQHPSDVTWQADLGVQKAEAAALVWSKKTVWATYAWSVD